METQGNQHQAFPPEYAQLNEQVTEAEARLRQLDWEMKRKAQHPSLDYTPPGTPPKVDPSPKRTRAEIQKEKDELKATVYQVVEKATANATPQAGKEMQDNAFSRLYREDIDQILARGPLADPAATWTLDKAQIKSLHMAVQARDEYRHEDQQSEARTMDEMTDRFLQKLELEPPQESTTERNPDREISDPEPES